MKFALRMVEVRHPIKLDGLPSMAVRQSTGANFTEPGVSCVNRDLTLLEVSADPVSLPLDADGEFNITYSCTDGGSTVSKVRHVKVVPTIQLRGDPTVLVQKDTVWNDPGVRCVDVDGKGLIQPVINPAVVTNVAAETEVTYTCTDSNMATWELNRTIKKVVNVISLTGRLSFSAPYSQEGDRHQWPANPRRAGA